MNKNKISEKILNKVNVLHKNLRENVFILCENYEKTKFFLDKFKFSYKPYRFAKSFLVEIDGDDLSVLSNLKDIKYIDINTKVSSCGSEKIFINIEHLTENKYLGQGQTICFIDTGIHPHFDFIFPKSRIVKFIDL